MKIKMPNSILTPLCRGCLQDFKLLQHKLYTKTLAYAMEVINHLIEIKRRVESVLELVKPKTPYEQFPK